jgi:hypothetical protein
VRQTPADIGASDLKKAKGARFSYDDDVEKGKTSISAEGLVGVSISISGGDRAGGAAPGDPIGSFYWIKLAPYVYYKSAHKRPASSSSKDIDYFSPGLAGHLIWLSPKGTFGFDLQLEASKTVDAANASEVYNAGIRFAPGLVVGGKPWLGGVVGWQGFPMLFKTDLALLARQHFVDDSGTSPELKGIDSYYGLGFDSLLSVYLNDKTGGVLSKLAASVGYRYEYNSAGVVDIERFIAGLSYEIGSNATVEFSYVSGRDANTLQLEERWLAGLTLKY